MFRKLKFHVRRLIKKTGYDLVNLNNSMQLSTDTLTVASKKLTDVIPFIVRSEEDQTLLWEFISFAGKRICKSNSQIMQDLFVSFILKEKRDGFFVEFGATDGVYLSNSLFLEKEYGWGGILAEPARIWKEALFANRKCSIDTRCVWSKTGAEIIFNETENPEISTIDSFSSNDSLAQSRKKGVSYSVPTISFVDLLSQYNAPKEIDYLSIDTEGSEFEILEAFNFDSYLIKIITVEHNYNALRNDIYNLLTEKGFKRMFESVSLYDDWYVHNSILGR